MGTKRKPLTGDDRPDIPLAEAKSLGDDILLTITSMVEKAEVVGSIRRGRPIVHDVDIILIPKPFMWPGAILARLKAKFEAMGTDFYVYKQGPLQAQIVVNGINVDFWVSSPDKWGLHRILKTGSAQHNIKLASLAKRQGKKLTELPNMETEEAIFEELGLEYIEPRDRE